MRAAGASLLALAVAFGMPAGARSEVAISGGAQLSGDNEGYRWDRYQLRLEHQDATSGLRLSLRWHTYSLREEFAGVLPFEGSEPAGELAGHLLLGSWWLAAAAGIQGTFDLEGATGKLVVAHAIPAGVHSFTPRVELARTALAETALPLSLGLSTHRLDGVLAWRAPGWTAEGGVRLDFWESDTVPGRVRNAALDEIDATRVTTLHAYLLTQRDHWFDLGVSARSAWSSRNTLLPTQLVPVWEYSWYPASAPPFLWETAVVLRASGRPAPSLATSLQLQLPAVSRETRAWQDVRRSDWGTGPFEAKLEASWFFLPSTGLRLEATLFIKPWENWELFSHEAYGYASAQLAIEQRI